jgi:hypothetical protein
MLDDLLLGAATVFTVGFAAAAWAGSDTLAAWLAGGLAAVALARVITLIFRSFGDEF